VFFKLDLVLQTQEDTTEMHNKVWRHV